MFIVDGGIWVEVEIFNILWNETLLLFNTDKFNSVKLFVEETVCASFCSMLYVSIFAKYYACIEFDYSNTDTLLHFAQIDNMILKAGEDDTIDPFKEGFVRTIVMFFKPGKTKMNDEWNKLYNESVTNATTMNATDLDDVRYKVIL